MMRRTLFAALILCAAVTRASAQADIRLEYAKRLPAAVLSVIEITHEYKTLYGLHQDQQRRDLATGIHSARADKLLAALTRLRSAAATATASIISKDSTSPLRVNFALEGRIIWLSSLVPPSDDSRLRSAAAVISRFIVEWAVAEGVVPFDLPLLAQEAFDKGVAAATRGDFLPAVQFFEEARKIAPGSPVLLFNLGLAESNIPGREMRAIVWLGAFLAADPQSPRADAIRKKIAELDTLGLNRFIRITEEIARQTPDQRLREAYLAHIAGFWAGASNDQMALRTIDGISSPDEKANGLAEIAGAQARFGDVASALRTVEHIPSNAFARSHALLDVASAQLSRGDLSGAANTSEAIVDPYYRVLVEQQIAAAQCEVGNCAGALQTLARALMRTEMIANSLRDDSKQRTALSLAKAGDFVAALRVANGIPDPFFASLANSSVAEKQAQMGDTSSARMTLAAARDAAIRVGHEGQRASAMERYSEVKAWIDRGTPGSLNEPRIVARPPSVRVSDWIWVNANLFDTLFFLDLGTYMKTLPKAGPSAFGGDPSNINETLKAMVGKMIDGRETLHRMLKQQASHAPPR